ncbi:TPA: hypothetical protein ACW0I5_004360 [Escherichia coli]
MSGTKEVDSLIPSEAVLEIVEALERKGNSPESVLAMLALTAYTLMRKNGIMSMQSLVPDGCGINMEVFSIMGIPDSTEHGYIH